MYMIKRKISVSMRTTICEKGEIGLLLQWLIHTWPKNKLFHL